MWGGDLVDEASGRPVDRRHVCHSAMAHVFLNEGEGVVLRSHFWLGAQIRPYLPAHLQDQLHGL